MQQSFNFDLITLTEATAQQLAWQRDRGNPTDLDLKEASLMIARWNVTRLSLGLALLDDDYDPPEPMVSTVIDDEDE